MVDNRKMEKLLQEPTEGYGEAIVIPEILAENFEIKTNLLQLVQANKFHGFERDNPHTHIANFKRMTVTLKYRDVPDDVIKLMLFPYSLEGAARIWVNTTSRESSSKTDDRIDKLADQISNLVKIVNKKVVTPAMVKAVEESCVICGGAHAYYDCIATNRNQSSICAATGSFFQNQASTLGTLPSNTIPNPKGEMKAITTRSGVAYEGTSIPTNPSLKKVVERETEETTDNEQTNFQGSTAHIQPLVIPIPIPKPNVPKTLPKPNIPYPSRLNDQKLREKAMNQMEKFFQIFQDLHFDISFADALLLMPKFASTIKSLLTNKDKLFELAKIPLNENCSAMLLKKLLEKLGDLSKFLIPCDFPGMDVCHALAYLGASINLMPLSIWKKLSLPELTPTRMMLELADRSITRPKGVAEDVFVKVGKFHFPTDFVVVDFDADPRVPLILERSFLRTGRALIDVYREEITLRVNDEAVTFNINQTTRYSFTYDDMSVNQIDVIDIAYEDDFILEEIEAYLKDNSISPEINHADLDLEGDLYLIEELLNNDPSSPLLLSHNPLSSSTTFSSPSLTPVETSDSLLEKFVDELALLESFPSGIGDDDFDMGGDILLLEKLLNDDPSSPLPLKELNFEKLKMIKSSIVDFSSINVYEEKSVTLSNPLFDSNDDFTSSDDESLSDDDVPEDNDIESKDSYVSNLDEPTLLVTPLSDANEDECFDPGGVIDEIIAFLDTDISTDNENGYHDSEGDIIYLESLLIDDTIPITPRVFRSFYDVIYFTI
ncbi:reverse transcriptase domain-containing protein [Tanacetum coccineum]